MEYRSISNGIRLHMTDDDPDDRLLVQEALIEANVDIPVDFTVDGQDLMHFLRGEGKYAGEPSRRLPDIILLDLNMPLMDGRECIKEIRNDPKLKHIPILVFTTSKADEDIVRSYQLGVNSFVQKPVEFDDLVRTMSAITDYWMKHVRLPTGSSIG